MLPCFICWVKELGEKGRTRKKVGRKIVRESRGAGTPTIKGCDKKYTVRRIKRRSAAEYSSKKIGTEKKGHVGRRKGLEGGGEANLQRKLGRRTPHKSPQKPTKKGKGTGV